MFLTCTLWRLGVRAYLLHRSQAYPLCLAQASFLVFAALACSGSWAAATAALWATPKVVSVQVAGSARVQSPGAATGAGRAQAKPSTPRPAGEPPDSRSRRPIHPVDVNAASAAELEQVRGIGPALAARIVAARHQGGRFRDTDDLRARVRGIGEANLRRMLAAGLSVPAPLRIEPNQAAARERVELIVGNSPSKAESRGKGRVEELACCGKSIASESR